jgi:hypothetical protein
MPESAWPNAKRRWAPEAIIGAVDERRTSVARAVLAFASTGLLVLILVGIAGVLVMRRLGTAEALRQAERIALVAGRGVVEPRLSEGIVRGDSSSLLTIDEVVSGSLLRGPIARVTIRDPDGRVLYADDPALIGSTVGLGASEQKAIRTGEAVTNEGTADELESRFEEDLGPLLEVSLPVSTPAGRPLLFQAYIPLDAVTASAEQLWRAFLPVLAVALIALAVVQIPLALRSRDRYGRRSRSASSCCDAPSNPRTSSADASPAISTTDPFSNSPGSRCRSRPLPAPSERRIPQPDRFAKRPRRCVGASGSSARRSWASIRRTCNAQAFGPRSPISPLP